MSKQEAQLGAVDKKLKEAMLRLQEAIAIMNHIRKIDYIEPPECDT
jgi:hypothetical protein